MKRWPTILLIASLVLNVFLAGAIAGGVWYWKNQPEERNSWRRHVSDALPAPQARAFHRAMKDTVRASRPVVLEGRNARAEAVRLMAAPVYDPAALLRQFDRARAADNILRANIERRVTAFAGTLPNDQREKLAKALEQGPLRQSPRR